MENVNKLEKQLEDVFENAPKIPENGRKAMVEWMPWIALVFGVLGVWSTYQLWRLSDRANDLTRGLNELSRAFGGSSVAPELSLFFWIAVIFSGLSAVMLLLAYPGLKDRKKAGWNWLFYGALLNVVYGVVSLFVDNYYGGGVGRLIGSLIGAAIGMWLLFQIRSHYKA